MSRTGNCYDNAVMESFFATLKGECLLPPSQTKVQARSTLFQFVEIWYNRQHMHSSLAIAAPLNLSFHSDIDRVHFLMTISRKIIPGCL